MLPFGQRLLNLWFNIRLVKMKGQMIFEFIIAAVMFFSIVFYVLNYLNVEVGGYSSDYFVNELENKAVQISELLMHNPGIWYTDDNTADVIGLSGRYPVINVTKAAMLDTYCNSNYGDFLDKLDMGLSTPYGGKLMNTMIILNKTNVEDNPLIECRYEPENVTFVRVERFGITEEGDVVKLTIGVWS